jgi:hypothetical protein
VVTTIEVLAQYSLDGIAAWRPMEIPEPYQAGGYVDITWPHPLDDGWRLRNVSLDRYPCGRYHYEGFRGVVQLW